MLVQYLSHADICSFDFDITRAINAPKTASVASEKAEDAKVQDSPNLDSEKKNPSVQDEVSVASVTSEQNELDPVALKKAFRFAAWSSVVLVGPLNLVLSSLINICTSRLLSCYWLSHYPSSSRIPSMAYGDLKLGL